MLGRGFLADVQQVAHAAPLAELGLEQLRGRGIGLAGSDGILEALQGLTNRRAGIGQFPWADDDQNDY